MIEIACFSLEAARIAQAAGADRIEFCVDKSLGGITPSQQAIEAARKAIEIPLFVMIRPRGGNFTYNEAEFAQMQADIMFCKECGIDGFVFGILQEDNTLNIAQNTCLVQLANPLPCTFHRAFDGIKDKSLALTQVIDCGFQRILTSGGEGNAKDFLPQLAQLMQQAQNRIIIMPGGGIRSHDIATIHTAIQANEYHSAAIETGDLPNEMEIRRLVGFFTQ